MPKSWEKEYCPMWVSRYWNTLIPWDSINSEVLKSI